MADGDSGLSTQDIARRRYLAMLCSTGASAVAGCSLSNSETNSGDRNAAAGDSDDPPSNDTQSSAFPDDPNALFRTVEARFTPEQYNWNSTLEWFSPMARHGVFAQWTQYLYSEDEFYPHLVETWEHGDGELVLTLSEAFTWGKNGESVTAPDLEFQLSVYEAGDNTAARFVEDATATGEYELTVAYSPEMSEDLVEYTLLPTLADVPPSNWRGTNWEYDPSGVTITDPDPSGPLAPVRIGEYEPEYLIRDDIDGYDDHRDAKNYNWRGYRSGYASAENPPQRLLIGGQLDGVADLFARAETKRQFPDRYREIRLPGGYGMGLWFDHDRERWQHRSVRRAFLHTIDPEAAIDAVGSSTKRQRTPPTGLTTLARDRWLDDEALAEFATYDGGSIRGDELLDEAGFSPGEFEVTLAYPVGWSDWAVACQQLLDQLDAAGWNVSERQLSGSPRVPVENGEFDVLAYPHTPSNRPHVHHPYFSLEHVLRGAPASEGHFANYDPGTVTVDGESIDVQVELDRLATTTPRDEQRPIVERLARVVNQEAPCAFVMEHVEQSFLDADRFVVPEESPHFQTRWPQWWLPKVDETVPEATRSGLLKFAGADSE